MEITVLTFLHKSLRKPAAGSIAGVLFSVFFLILYLVYNTETILFTQKISFLATAAYIRPYFSYGGGFSDGLGILLSAFLGNRWTGAFLLFLLLVSIGWLVLRLLKSMGVHSNIILVTSLFFSFTAALFLNPFFVLAFHLKLLIGLLLANLIFILPFRDAVQPFLSILILWGIWYLCGFLCTASFILAIALFYTSKKRHFTALLVLISSLAGIYLLKTALFFTVEKNALKSLAYYNADLIPFYIAILAYLPLMVGLLLMRKRISVRPVFQFLAVVGFSITAIALLYHPTRHNMVKLLSAGYSGNHDQVIELRKKTSVNSRVISAYTNLALLHKGKLLESMFEYSQVFGKQGLIPERGADCFDAFVNMKVCYELGMVNESIRWAMEAATLMGYNPQILTHLVRCFLIKGNESAALKYAYLLECSPFCKSDKKRIRDLVSAYKTGRSNPYLSLRRKELPLYDFITIRDNAAENFLWSLDPGVANPKGLEILGAVCLIDYTPDYLPYIIQKFRQLGYPRLPRYLQEMVLHEWMKNGIPPDLAGYSIERGIVERGQQYFALASQNTTDQAGIFNRLTSEFGDTFWCFHDFAVVKN